MKLYPVKPVITSNPQLASSYNTHPVSGLLASACLTVDEASRLLQDGALFDTILLLNGEGEDVVNRIGGDKEAWDNEIMPSIKRLVVPMDANQAVETIHAALRDMEISSMG